MKEKRAVLFDIDGVLIHSMFHPDLSRRRAWDTHLKEDLGVDVDMFRLFFRDHFSPVLRGHSSLVSELDKFLPGVGYQGSSLDFIAYWMKYDNQLNLQLISAIKRLAKSPGIEIYLATNQEHLRAFHLWSNVGLSHIFKDMFYAARLGEAKPDKAYFDAVDALLGPQSEPPLFFDDGQKNIDAANIHGWEACLFDVNSDFTSHPWVAGRLENDKYY